MRDMTEIADHVGGTIGKTGLLRTLASNLVGLCMETSASIHVLLLEVRTSS